MYDLITEIAVQTEGGNHLRLPAVHLGQLGADQGLLRSLRRLKLRRMNFKHDPGFYSANGLVQALGIDSHPVSRWIRSGHLKAKLRGTARGEKQNGDIYLILEKDVRRFILEHPTEIDLRKVDQLWLFDLVTNGLVRSV